MPGSGTMTPAVPPTGATPTGYPLARPDSCLSLARYAKIVRQDECAFWGIFTDDQVDSGCDTIWTEDDRQMVSDALAEAQEELEQVLGYPICPTWFADEQRPYAPYVFSIWGKVIQAGIRAETMIAAGSAVNHLTDPATVGPIATTVTDTDEIVIYHPDSDRVITPSQVIISGGNVTIWIPRCRMVAEQYLENPSTGWDYNDTSYFLATVDVKRVYNDPSTNATMVWPHSCSSDCSVSGCSEYAADACMYINYGETGQIATFRASYSGGSWVRSSCAASRPGYVRLNYQAGLPAMTHVSEMAIVRLAHSKMPEEPCGCETLTRLWARDRNVPPALTPERANCPFGLNDGAWHAWRFAQAIRLVRGSTL